MPTLLSPSGYRAGAISSGLTPSVAGDAGGGAGGTTDAVARASATAAAGTATNAQTDATTAITDAANAATAASNAQTTADAATVTATNAATVAANAQTAANTNQTNIEALTAQPGETIPVNGVVFGPWGTLENATGGPLPLDATDPQTEASLLNAGLTEPEQGTLTETPTNFTVPATAFPDASFPKLAEAQAWYDANVGPGLTFAVEQTPGDTLKFGDWIWTVGDGDTPDTLILNSQPSGGVETEVLTTVTDLWASGKDRALRRYYLDAETPLTDYSGQNRVAWTLNNAPAGKEVEIIRTSTAEVQINANVDGDAEGLHVNQIGRIARLLSLGGGNWAFSQ